MSNYFQQKHIFLADIDSILEIIKKTKGLNVEEVAAVLGYDRTHMYNKPALSQTHIKKFVEKYSTEMGRAGFELVDNYDIFGYKGKAIVKTGQVLYGGKFIQVSEEDSKNGVQGINSDQAEKSFAGVLKSVAKAQQELADRLKTLSAAAESISSEELDKLFQAISPLGKGSIEKKGKPGK